jgi:multiple sugar transport system substrate-binding protein
MDDNLIFGTKSPSNAPDTNVNQPTDFSQQVGQQANSAFSQPPISEPNIAGQSDNSSFNPPVIDQPSNPPSSQVNQESVQPVNFSEQTGSAVPPPSIPPPPENNGQENQGEEKKSFFSLGSILKIFVGLAVVVILIFAISKFLLPMFNKQKTGNITLTYWGLWEDSNVMQSTISDFEKNNPSIKVNYVKQDSKQYRERLLARMDNGTGPDIFRFHNTWYPMLAKVLIPIPTDVITSKDFKSLYYPATQKDLLRNGAIYGIPLEIDTLALYVNDDAFKSVGIAGYPTTWEEFINAARKLTVKDETGKIRTAGAAMGTFDNISHAPDIISMLFLQNGVKLSDMSSTSQEASDALKFYTQFATGDGNVWNNTLDNSILAFAKGSVVMCFGYSWDAFTIKALNPNLNYKVIPAPQLIVGKIAIASYWVEGVSARSKYQKEALTFLKFLAQKETAQKLFTEQSKTRMYGEPYARVDLAVGLKANALVFPFVDQGKIAQSSYMVDSTYDDGLNTKANGYLQAAVNSIVKSDTSESTATETLVNGINQVLQQYGQ